MKNELNLELDRMSSNIIDIIDELLKHQDIVNYVGYDGNNPSTQNIDPKTIAPYGENERIFPYPFNQKFNDKVRSQVHVYYPIFKFKNNGHVNKLDLNIDIITHRDIWLTLDNGVKIIRPYHIAHQITSKLKGRIVGKVGKIHFIEGYHTFINESFEGIRLVATFSEF